MHTMSSFLVLEKLISNYQLNSLTLRLNEQLSVCLIVQLEHFILVFSRFAPFLKAVIVAMLLKHLILFLGASSWTTYALLLIAFHLTRRVSPTFFYKISPQYCPIFATYAHDLDFSQFSRCFILSYQFNFFLLLQIWKVFLFILI